MINVLLIIIGVVAVIGLLLLCLANRLVDVYEFHEQIIEEPEDRQIRVLSKFDIGRKNYSHGEQVLFLDPMRTGEGWKK